MRFSRTGAVFFLLLVFARLNETFAEPKTEALPLPEGFQFRTLHDSTGTHPYAVFVPRQYRADQKWPVVLFLHGAGERGNDPRLLLGGQLAVALEHWPDLPFIAVFPQCEDQTGRALTGWLAGSSDADRALKILAEVERHFSINPQRRILAGWSMGGYGAWSLAAALPEKWSAVLVLAGGALHDQLPLEKLAAQKTPVWAISARRDPLIPFERSQKLIAELNRLGGQGTFTLLESEDHDFCPQVFGSQKLFDWLVNPHQVIPAKIQFDEHSPLPEETRYYEREVIQRQTIPRALAIRLGNEPFQQLARELPALLSSAPFSGTLPDVDQTLGSSGHEMRVRLTGLRYQCDVTEIWAHGISGGRLGLDVSFHPLELAIEKTSLDSLHNQATTGPIHVRIGIHEPAILKLEVQPVTDSGKLVLRLLRKQFQFRDSNWYIVPPTEVDAHSDKFTSDQLVTGIVGSLYGARDDLTQRILNVVPELLHRAEAELQLRSAPGLARILSPLPVLVPDVKVSPARVRTDARGVSVVCDLKIGVRGQFNNVPILTKLQLSDLPDDDRISLDIGLGAITSISQLTVDQNAARVNVLDISEEKFAQLADPRVMNEVLPGLHAANGEQLHSILRLVDPMVVTGKSASVASATSAELTLSSSKISIDVYRSPAAKTSPIPVGQILFSLKQIIRIHPPTDEDDLEAAFQLVWDPECRVEFLHGDSLAGSPVPEVNGNRFEQVFKEAWSTWGQAHGGQEIPMTVSRVGSSRLRLHQLKAAPRRLNLQLDVQSDLPPGPKNTSMP